MLANQVFYIGRLKKLFNYKGIFKMGWEFKIEATNDQKSMILKIGEKGNEKSFNWVSFSKEEAYQIIQNMINAYNYIKPLQNNTFVKPFEWRRLEKDTLDIEPRFQVTVDSINNWFVFQVELQGIGIKNLAFLPPSAQAILKALHNGFEKMMSPEVNKLKH